ncbi:MAG TPA: hypothetical protein VFV52_03060 [Bacilli bacterium]|nr:hypothetical protein [Bacilli bacterium]
MKRPGRVIPMQKVLEQEKPSVAVKPIGPTCFMFEKEEDQQAFVQDLFEGTSNAEGLHRLKNLISGMETTKPFKKR